MAYTAQMGGASWSRGPQASFESVKDARQWAESYGNTADFCRIYDSNGRMIEEYCRSMTSGAWYNADLF